MAAMHRMAAFLLLLATPLLAQQPPPKTIGAVTLFGEEQLKVEAATKTETPISKVPSAVTVITRKQIDESGMHTVPDLLRLVAGVNVRWNPMTQTIDIRGFGENPFSNRVLLLIDGQPYNSGDTGGFPLSPAFDLFPVQNIKRIEVVRGPGSSLYGENAFWGVVNIVTLSGEDLAGAAAQVYAGSRSTREATAMYGQKFDRGSILASVRLNQSMFPQEFWIDDHSKIKGSDLFVKGTLGDWTISAYRHDEKLDGFDEEFGGEVPGLPPTAGFRSAHELKQTLDSLTLRYNHAPQGAKITYAADFSYSHRNGMHCAGCHAAQQDPHFGERADHGYQAIGDFRLGLHMIPGHDALVGVEARRLDRAEHVEELSADARPAGGYDKIAVYLQDQFDLIKDKLGAVVGVRYDGKTDLFDAKTSPRLALVYTPSDRLVVRGGYSTAFRFPTFSELYQSSWFLTLSTEIGVPPFPLSVFHPNPQLQPEEISTWNIGGEYQFSPRLSAKADIYRSKVHDFIVVVQHFEAVPAPTFGWENQPADARITGGEFELRANLTDSVTGFANWTHQSYSQAGAGTDSSGIPFEFVYSPKNKINVGAYAGPFNGVRGTLEVAWKGEYDAPRNWFAIRSGFTSFATRPLPSYALVNGRVSYDFGAGKNRPIRFSVIGNNLLNKRPEETMVGGVNRLVGREVYGQIEVHF